MWIPDVDSNTILLALTVSSAIQTPKAFAALGSQVLPRLGGEECAALACTRGKIRFAMQWSMKGCDVLGPDRFVATVAWKLRPTGGHLFGQSVHVQVDRSCTAIEEGSTCRILQAGEVKVGAETPDKPSMGTMGGHAHWRRERSSLWRSISGVQICSFSGQLRTRKSWRVCRTVRCIFEGRCRRNASAISSPRHFPDILRTSQATKAIQVHMWSPLCAIHKQLAKIVGTSLPGLTRRGNNCRRMACLLGHIGDKGRSAHIMRCVTHVCRAHQDIRRSCHHSAHHIRTKTCRQNPTKKTSSFNIRTKSPPTQVPRRSKQFAPTRTTIMATKPHSFSKPTRLITSLW